MDTITKCRRGCSCEPCLWRASEADERAHARERQRVENLAREWTCEAYQLANHSDRRDWGAITTALEQAARFARRLRVN